MVHSVSISCPSCGVAIENITAHTRSLTCPHCGNWVYLGSNGWESAGLFEHAIDAPSMLNLGKTGELSDRRFTVSGRVRLSYSDGFWDEWWLDFDDGYSQWVEEDDGVYLLHKFVEVKTDVAAVHAAKVGGRVVVNGESLMVTERIDTQVAGVQGRLPTSIVPGERIICVDVMGGGRKLSLEAGDNEVQVTQSVAVPAAHFHWS